MKNPGIPNGIAYGIATVVVSMILYFIGHRAYLNYGSWISIVIAVFFMYKAAIAARGQMEGFMTFSEALNPTFLTWTIGTLISSIFAYILFNFIDPSLMDTLMDIQIEAMDKMEGMFGIDSDQVELMKEAVEEKGSDMNISTVGFGWIVGLLIPGFFIAAIIALITKRKDTTTFA